jgi:hypothetical protein
MKTRRALLLAPLAAVLPLVLAGTSLQTSAPAGPATSFAPSPAWVGVAHPRDWVRLGGGWPTVYNVGVGKVFALTALGTPLAFSYAGRGESQLLLNGAKALAVQTVHASGTSEALPSVEVLEAPVGWTARGGDTISLAASDMCAWGYVVEDSGPTSAGLVVPHASEWMRIQSSYTVPAGKILVVTAVGTTELFDGLTVGVELRVDGITEVTFEPSDWTPTLSLTPLPPGLAAGPGQVVSCYVASGSGQPGVFLGFLVDA